MINVVLQATAFTLLEELVNDGHKFSALPISADRAGDILDGRVSASQADLEALRLAVKDNTTPYNRKIGR